MPKPNVEAERSVIGAILIAADKVLPHIISELSAEDFLVPEYRNIFKAIQWMFHANKPVDFVTVLGNLSNDNGYKVLMAEAVEATPSTGNFESYVALVKKAAALDRAYYHALDLMREIECGEDLQACQDAAIRASEAFNISQREDSCGAAEGLTEFIKRMQSEREYIRTGFSKLDRFVKIRKGKYIVVGGRPSGGKTAITLQMMLAMARQYRVAYFSLETDHSGVFDRLCSNFFNIPMDNIIEGNLQDWGYLPAKADDFRTLQSNVIEASGWTVAQIQAKAIQMRVDVVFIDYLGLIKSEGKSRYEKITNISVDLHTMAQQHNIAVIALSQLSRSDKTQKIKAPTLEDLRESGQIEQDADVVLLLHKPDEDSEVREVIIAKNKEGRTGKLRFGFNGQYQRFHEIETRFD